MGGAGNRPPGRAQDQVAGREPGVHGVTLVVHTTACRRAYPAVPPLQEAWTAALQQRVAQQAARDHGARPPRVGEERTPCSLPAIGLASSQRNAQQGRHTDCRG